MRQAFHSPDSVACFTLPPGASHLPAYHAGSSVAFRPLVRCRIPPQRPQPTQRRRSAQAKRLTTTTAIRHQNAPTAHASVVEHT
jgi:hypothetical protein